MLTPLRQAPCTNPLCVDIMACCDTQTCATPEASDYGNMAGLVANAPDCVALWCADPALRLPGFATNGCWTGSLAEATEGTQTLLKAQGALDEAWADMWRSDDCRTYSGRCCQIVRPCLPCGFCGCCGDCGRNACLPLDVPGCQDLNWVDVVEAYVTITDSLGVTTETAVHIPGVFDNPTSDWRLNLAPNAELCAQVQSPNDPMPTWPSSTGQGSQPVGTPQTWGLIIVTEPVVPFWYSDAVADLACVIMNRCVPAGRCDLNKISGNVTSRSNDGETIQYEIVELDDLIEGHTGLNSVDNARARLAGNCGRRTWMADPLGSPYTYIVEPADCPGS